MLLVGLFGALFPVLGVTGPLPPTDTREVQLNAPATLPGTAPASPVALRGTHDAVLIFTAPSFADGLLLALPTLVGNLLLMAALSILLRVARTFRDGVEPAGTTRIAAQQLGNRGRAAAALLRAQGWLTKLTCPPGRNSGVIF